MSDQQGRRACGMAGHLPTPHQSTVGQLCRSALVLPRHPYICEAAPLSEEKNRAVRSKGSRRAYAVYRLKNVIKESENKPKTKRLDATLVLYFSSKLLYLIFTDSAGQKRNILENSSQ